MARCLLAAWLTCAPNVVAADQLDRDQLRRIRTFVAAKIADRVIPGAVVVVGTHRGVVAAAAYGRRTMGATSERMKVDTVFDLASVTKPIAGASALLQARESLRLSLGELTRVGDHKLELRHLASHASGLPPVIDVGPILDASAASPGVVLAQIGKTSLLHSPGAGVTYSDLGYIVLGRAVERAVAMDLEVFLQTRVFGPLGMVDTTFRPSAGQRSRRAPTYPPGSSMLGQTHNKIVRAYLDDTHVPGHAGLYSTGPDLARYAQMMLNDGVVGSERVFAERSVEAMTAPLGDTGMTIGWSVWPAPDGSHAVGKVGWLGTFIWVHPGADLFVVYLTNRTHVRDDDDVYAPGYDGLVEIVWAAHVAAQ